MDLDLSRDEVDCGDLYGGGSIMDLSDKSQASRTRRLSGDGETGVWGRRIQTKKIESQDKLTSLSQAMACVLEPRLVRRPFMGLSLLIRRSSPSPFEEYRDAETPYTAANKKTYEN